LKNDVGQAGAQDAPACLDNQKGGQALRAGRHQPVLTSNPMRRLGF